MKNTKLLTLGEAAKASGWSKPVISKALKSGKLSCVSKSKSGYQIDPAELNRVFPKKHLGNDNVERLETPDLLLENTRLQAELKGKDREIELLADQVENLKDTIKLLPAPQKPERRVFRLFGIPVASVG